MKIWKSPRQPALTSQMYGHRGFKMPQPATEDVMVHSQNAKNASFVLVHFYVFFKFCQVLLADLTLKVVKF